VSSDLVEDLELILCAVVQPSAVGTQVALMTLVSVSIRYVLGKQVVAERISLGRDYPSIQCPPAKKQGAYPLIPSATPQPHNLGTPDHI